MRVVYKGNRKKGNDLGQNISHKIDHRGFEKLLRAAHKALLLSGGPVDPVSQIFSLSYAGSGILFYHRSYFMAF